MNLLRHIKTHLLPQHIIFLSRPLVPQECLDLSAATYERRPVPPRRVGRVRERDSASVSRVPEGLGGLGKSVRKSEGLTEGRSGRHTLTFLRSKRGQTSASLEESKGGWSLVHLVLH